MCVHCILSAKDSATSSLMWLTCAGEKFSRLRRSRSQICNYHSSTNGRFQFWAELFPWAATKLTVHVWLTFCVLWGTSLCCVTVYFALKLVGAFLNTVINSAAIRVCRWSFSFFSDVNRMNESKLVSIFTAFFLGVWYHWMWFLLIYRFNLSVKMLVKAKKKKPLKIN